VEDDQVEAFLLQSDQVFYNRLALAEGAAPDFDYDWF
jgi:hypothetical protein